MSDIVEPVNTSDEMCSLICMLVSNPGGRERAPGWQKRVNDLIRALRAERNELRKYRPADDRQMKRAQELVRDIEAIAHDYAPIKDYSDLLAAVLARAASAEAEVARLKQPT